VWGINLLRGCQAVESSSRQEPGHALTVEWTVIVYIEKQLLMRCSFGGRGFSGEFILARDH
jgi:hypothetical protein